MSNPVLHSYWRSSASWRVRIALAHKGIDYEYRAVHLVADGGQQHSASYRKLNPMREVPTLEIEGVVLTQSLAILEFLEERFPSPALLPSDAFERAQVRRLSEIINSGMQPVQNLRVLQHLGSEYGVDGEGRKAWARHWIQRGFEGLEPLTAASAGSRCVRDHVTFADICLVPQVYNAHRFGVDMAQFPTLSRVHANLEVLDAFRAAHPDVQPDAQ